MFLSLKDALELSVFGLPVSCEKDYITFLVSAKESRKVHFCNYSLFCSPLKKDLFRFQLTGINTTITGQFKVAPIPTGYFKQLIDIITYEIPTVEIRPYYLPIRSGVWKIQTPHLDTVITYRPQFVIRPEVDKD